MGEMKLHHSLVNWSRKYSCVMGAWLVVADCGPLCSCLTDMSMDVLSFRSPSLWNCAFASRPRLSLCRGQKGEFSHYVKMWKEKKKFTDELLMRRKINHVRNFAKGLRSMSTGKRINKYHVVLLHIAMIQRCGQFSGFSVRKGQKIIIFELCVCTSRPAFQPKSVNYLNAWAQQRHGKRWIFVLPWKTCDRFSSVYVPFIFFKTNMVGLAASSIWQQNIMAVTIYCPPCLIWISWSNCNCN